MSIVLFFFQDPEAFEREYAALILRDAPTTAPTRPVAAAAGDAEDPDAYTTVGRGGKAMQFSAEGILKNLQAVQEARGKKVRYSSAAPPFY
jgi:translation initiation factor 3 subunit C